MTHSRLLLGLLLGVVVLGAIFGLEATPARADIQTNDGITVDYKADLLDAAADLLDLSWDLLSDLRTRLFAPLKDIKDWKVEAQATLEGCLKYSSGDYDACVARAKDLIQSADEMKLQSAYPGIQVVYGTLSELEEEVISLALEIEQGILDGNIGQSTAESLAKDYDRETLRPKAPLLVILIFLSEKDMLLVEMDKLLEQANEYESEALAWLNTVTNCGTNANCQKKAVKQALAALKKSVRVVQQTMKYLWKVKDNIKFIAAWLCGFQQLVIRAPILKPAEESGSSSWSCPWCLASTGLEVRTLAERGVIRFVALGPEVEGLRVQVFNLAGRSVFDSGSVMGNTFEWHILNSRGSLLANGVYLYVITVKGRDGALISSEVKKLAIVR